MKIKNVITAAVAALLISLQVSAQTLKDAIHYSESERYDLADAAFKKLLVSDASNGDIYYYFGRNYLSLEDLDSARVVFQMGTEKAPANALNFVGLAAVAMNKADKATAQNHINTALKLSDNKSIPVYIEASYALINGTTKDTAQAMRLLEKARDLDLGKDKKPKNPALYVAIGDVALEAGNNKGGQAMTNYEKATTIDAKYTKSYLRQGQLWVRARNFGSALESYNKAIKLDTTFAPAYRERGDFYFMFEKYGLGKEDYKKYVTLAKDNFKARIKYVKFLFLAKQYNDVITEGPLILAIDQSQTVIKRLMAYSYFELRKYPESLKYIQDFMATQPKDKLLPSDYEYYGKSLVKADQDSLGLKVLLDAYNADTSKKELAGYIGEAYRDMKKFPEAIQYFKIKISVGKDVKTIDYLNLGSAYFQNRQWAEADTAFAQAIIVQPEYSKGYLFRARCQAKLDSTATKTFAGKPFYELFIKKLKSDEVDANKPGLSEAYKYIGYAHYTNKQYKYAKFMFNKALEYKPDDKDTKEILEKPEFKDVTPEDPATGSAPPDGGTPPAGN